MLPRGARVLRHQRARASFAAPFTTPTRVRTPSARVFTTSATALHSMPPPGRVVYLEDLQALPEEKKETAKKEPENENLKEPENLTAQEKAPEPETAVAVAVANSATVTGSAETEVVAGATATATAVTTPASKASAPAGAGTKRQRTLVDMFAGPAAARATGPGPAPKRLKAAGTSSGLQSLNSIPFSLSAFQETLTDEEKKLLALECETMGKSWLKLLKDEIRKPYFIALKRFLYEAGVKGPADSAKSLKVYPSPSNIYAWSNLTPLGRVKVVIIGQDPYHGPGQAHGLCFSVPPGVAVPPSLRNIYAEIRAEYPAFEPPKHGTLTAWAENGVLLLNTCLTVRAGAAGSHSGQGWETFTERVVDVVDRYGGANLAAGGAGRGIVFLAWGAWAAKRVAKLDKKKHLILASAHPSPLSASRGFLGNGHFKQANAWLEAKYGRDGCVDWCAL